MLNVLAALGSRSLRAMRLVGLLGAAALVGCATHYVDGNTKEVSASAYRKPAEPKPVQVLFEFQSRGTLNARATDLLKAQVIEQVKGSGLFASIDDKPVAGGALLSLTLNNVPLTDAAFAKGFMTGLTFGAVGSQVSDGYVCTVAYTSTQQPQPVTKVVRHAIHTTMGASGAPPNSTKADNLTVAVQTMTRQIVSASLNELSQDTSFK